MDAAVLNLESVLSITFQSQRCAAHLTRSGLITQRSPLKLEQSSQVISFNTAVARCGQTMLAVFHQCGNVIGSSSLATVKT